MVYVKGTLNTVCNTSIPCHCSTYLKFVSVEDLSILTITSKAMRNAVELYKNTLRAQQYLLPMPIRHGTIPVTEESYYMSQFQKLGKDRVLRSCMQWGCLACSS